jgi:three-Cys-motif partner protein
MTAHDDFFRKPKPVAVFKHSLLEEYCNVFTSMLGSRWRGPIWFIDGYAGPGAYEADDDGPGHPGSPLVAMRLAEVWQTKGTRDLRCAFIESSSENVQRLRKRLEPFEEKGLTCPVYEGVVQEKLTTAWSNVEDSPALTFLDPFGVAMDRSLLLDPLLSPRRGNRPSEVLVNINVEAVWRIGGNLQRRGSDVVPTTGQEKAIERVDRFLGGEWWREQFFESRGDEGSAAAAAARVIDAYRKQVESDAGCSSISVPIRRRPGHSPLFLMTLFHREPVAAYKFADAASRATKRWRDTFRAIELADWQDEGDALFGADVLQGISDAEAEAQEAILHRDWVRIIKQNMHSLVAALGTVPVKRHVVEILGSSISLAGEKQLRTAWDELAVDGVLKPRDKSQKLYKLSLVATRS